MLTINEVKEKTKDIFGLYPVRKVSVFGSFARGEMSEGSDIDMLIQDSNIGIMDASNLRSRLESALHNNIDLVDENDLSDVFKFLIKDDEVVIYEKQG
ncbi:MAG: nucleotidyltransferase domain-containing protein [Lachnospiraceae bacterium]|nr:nucleotidyltransferase domain-containing protein [Lachnospiraceae bacterium]